MAKTLAQLVSEIKKDLNLESVPYSSGNRFIGDAEIKTIIQRSVRDAEALIHNLYEDYFRTSMYLPLVQGSYLFSLPSDIYANKIRRIIYDNGSEFYRVLRIDNITEFQLPTTEEGYKYYMSNSEKTGCNIRLAPVSRENSQLGLAIALANSLKYYFNLHILDAAQHTTAADTVNTITASYATDEFTLYTLIENMIDCYDAHEGDAELALGWVYHAAQEAADHSLTSTSYPETISDSVTMLNDFLTKYNAHDADATAHGVGSLHQETKTAVTETANNITVYYIRKARVLINDTDVLDIPEFENYIIADAKHRVLFKDPGNPIRQDIYQERSEQRDLMIQTLSNRVPDDQSDMRADTSFYEDFYDYGYDY